MIYILKTGELPDDANPELVAYLLERAADWIRAADGWDDARDLSGAECGVSFTHGVQGGR
jgi:hypothetical protein